MSTVQIELPDDVRKALDLDEAELTALALEALTMRLYERGEISSGKGAELLGITRRDFLARLSEYGLSSFDEDIDFAQEMLRGRL